MKKEMLYSATAALFAGALLLPVTMPKGARAAESHHEEGDAHTAGTAVRLIDLTAVGARA